MARESQADSTTEGGFRWRGRRTTGASDAHGGCRAGGIRGPTSNLTCVRHFGPATLVTKGDPEAWLAAEHRLISMGEWTEPKVRRRRSRRDLRHS